MPANKLYRITGLQQKKLHNLTQLGREDDRRRYFRRDANCPAVVSMSTRHSEERFTVTGLVVNISEQGCMITAGALPWRDDVLEAGRDESLFFPRIAERVQIQLPWTGTKVNGVVKQQGNHTLRIQFIALLPEMLVDRIARMTPAKQSKAPAKRPV